ncbi:TPA: DUF192 domain-containing protein [Candidatus Saccharibacteria bacterium]|nr:DUF192 domain-containing protein [Candidatus Saccharibacteria bacterium]HIO87475.1 DUF192 domain-containing protein [Candidatus Saccharibacteria bacterium]
MNARQVIGIGVVLAASLLGGLFFINQQATAPDQLNAEYSFTVGEQTFDLLVADEPHEQITGLSGREGLDDDRAMLFVFDESAQHGIWMKDMLFSIDIVWLNSEKRVVHIESNISPDTYPRIFKPEENSKYVIEFNAGAVAKLGLSAGDTVEF